MTMTHYKRKQYEILKYLSSRSLNFLEHSYRPSMMEWFVSIIWRFLIGRILGNSRLPPEKANFHNVYIEWGCLMSLIKQTFLWQQKMRVSSYFACNFDIRYELLITWPRSNWCKGPNYECWPNVMNASRRMHWSLKRSLCVMGIQKAV